MILSISDQTRLFLLTVLIGIFIGLMYDVFRIMRKTFKHPGFLIQLEDILYWLFASFAMFYFILNKNDGELRAFSIFGAFSGMIIYFLTFSPIIMKISMTVIDFIKKILNLALKIILFPFRVILRILKIPFDFIHLWLVKILRPTKKVLQNSRRCARIKFSHSLKNLKIVFKKV